MEMRRNSFKSIITMRKHHFKGVVGALCAGFIALLTPIVYEERMEP